MASTDTERYVRLTLLLFEGGTWICKEIVVRELDHDPGVPGLSVLLQNHKRAIKQKHDCKQLSRKQYLTLKDTISDDNCLKDWDIQLLVKMNLFLFDSALSGQDKSDLIDLLKIRNDIICHKSQPRIDRHVFVVSWTQLTSCLTRLASGFEAETGQKMSELIDNLMSGPLDLQSSISKLTHICRNEECMENVQEELFNIKQGQQQIIGVLGDLVSKVGELKRICDQDQLKVNIPNVKTMQREDTKTSTKDSDEVSDRCQSRPGFKAITDRFTSLGEVTKEIKKHVNVPVGLIFGIDYTLSNLVQGTKTFGGKSLHCIEDGCVNPFQEVICILGETLQSFNDDGMIPAFGFGDIKVKGDGVFPLKEDIECDGFLEVLDEYNNITSQIKLGGPTNFAPLIEKAIEIVMAKKQFHILVIVADGQVVKENETVAAIVKASRYPLSIVVIGVGDGPWDMMGDFYSFDDQLPERLFDNFQFVDYHAVKSTARNPEASLALAALMEIPDQLKEIQENGLLENM